MQFNLVIHYEDTSKRHVLKGGVESWTGVLKTPNWSVVYDFSVDVFCKLGIDK